MTNMITITGLTHKQKAIMDILWACNSIEQAELFIRSMPTDKDRADANSLMQIAIMETLEQEGRLDLYAANADMCIAHARSH
jgi:hypothetical protein